MGVTLVSSRWSRPACATEWEMHPEQDELLYLLESAIDVVYLQADLEESEEDPRHVTQGQAWRRSVGCIRRNRVGPDRAADTRRLHQDAGTACEVGRGAQSALRTDDGRILANSAQRGCTTPDLGVTIESATDRPRQGGRQLRWG
jgi:hypothetical protein